MTDIDIEDAKARRACRVLRHQHYPEIADFIRQELVDGD